MRANRPIGLISRDCVAIHCRQNCEALLRRSCFGKSGGVSSLAADRRRHADELGVELNNRSPLNTATTCPPSMYRLNRGFQLKAAWNSKFGCVCEKAFRLFY